MIFRKQSYSKRQSEVISIIITSIIGWSFAYLAIVVFTNYAVGLFIWLPIMMGAISVILYWYFYSETAIRKGYRYVAFMALLVFCLGLLTFAFEGIICIAMAAPIGVLFTWVGYKIGYWIVVKSKSPKNKVSTMLILIISIPTFMGFEYITIDNNDNTLRSVTTSIEINASPEIVWKNVISFPELAAPDEFIFKTGIAYPINAKIDGSGVGAIRHCNFSTGSFVEPITVWDEPKLLQFDVADQPEPMKELSPYNIHPNHLHSYFVSKKGQFKLIPLQNGHTLLEGTTWYYNKILPNFYWTLWSDYIVHKIHQRVLEHIKREAEEVK